ncbi:MAG TPA: PKD domain-containing protein, partial [Pseudomonadales bacterium]|nr:PKD domain-containing protein [Pseudomonadales bacterium]
MRHQIYPLFIATLFLGLLVMPISAATLYVNVNNPHPTPPYAGWSTAATNIQQAVDVANPGDTVLVTNGVYQAGGRPVSIPDFGPALTNRVIVTNSILLRSVNGPAVTVIAGYQVPGTINDNNAVRCVYLDNGAILSGFTLTNGATGPGGSDGVWESWGGGVSSPGNAVVTNCIIINNSSGDYAGGANGGTYNNCQFIGNQSTWVGGAESCILNNCALYGNSCTVYGGCADSCTLNHCTLTGNFGSGGAGGATYSTLNDCIVYFNSGSGETNCSSCTLNYSCTTPLPGTNSDSNSGTNNITAAPQMADAIHLAATSPCIGAGSANYSGGTDIDGQPWRVPPSIGCDEYYAGVTGSLGVSLSSDYPEAVPGFALTFTGQITGHARANVWNFGDGTQVSNQVFNVQHSWSTPGNYPVIFTAYNDDHPGGISATTTIQVASQLIYYVNAGGTSPVPPFNSWATAATNIQDAIDVAEPTPLTIVLVTNGIYQTTGRVAGESATNSVVVSAPILLQSAGGPSATIIDGAGAMRCLYLASGARVAGFTLTNGASFNDGGGVFCQIGATVSNCLVTGNFAAGNGGGVTGGTIFHSTMEGNSAASNGGGANNGTLSDCVLANNYSFYGGGANNSTLSNCLVTANTSGSAGGGVEFSTLIDCTIVDNVATNGGGADSSSMYSCLLTNNLASLTGGGVNNCYDINCTIVNNSAGQNGGGAAGSELDNCIAYFNAAPADPNFTADNSTINNSCTTPQAPGTGNFTNDPAFEDLVAGNLHLQNNSPCINAGGNNYLTNNNSGIDLVTDLDGNPRLTGLTVDCGAYEFPIPAAIADSYTNVAAGFAVNFDWQIVAGNVSEFLINFGDGTVLTNPPTAAHQWAAPGDYTVTITAFSDLDPGGVSTNIEIHVVQGNYFVSLDSANPQPPYTSWNTAANNIQDAVNAAYAGGTIWVSNGVYQTGSSTADGTFFNRVTATEPLTLRSVNGPGQTVIDGGGSVRCVYLANDSTLNGFTLQNGNAFGDVGGGVAGDSTNVAVSNCAIDFSTAFDGGGAYQVTLDSCILSSNSAASNGGGAENCMMNACTLSANIGVYGGGADSSTLTHCTLFGNSVDSFGGGACSSTLFACVLSNNAAAAGGGTAFGYASNCTFTFNSSGDYGGGAAYAELDGCLLSSNQAVNSGGGASSGTLNNCTLTGNSVIEGSGGGACNATLTNSTLYGNSAFNNGGGAESSILNNCTLTGNSAAIGGGADASTLDNCIDYYNSAFSGTNFSGSTLNFCCTTPLPDSGTNDITGSPLMADLAHISAFSPCAGAGSAAYSSGVDIDGQPWRNPPAIGCDEYYSGTITGALSVAILADYTNVSTGFTAHFTALIDGHASSNRWNFGDGTMASNSPYVLHSWSAPGNYQVVLSVYNETYPGGLSATSTVHVVTSPVYYVSPTSPNPVAPYTSWATAATNIQDAVDAAIVGGTVLVSNGVYQTGGEAVNGGPTNQVAINKPIKVQSVNGPAVTIIQGNPAPSNPVRCVYLANNAMLAGFTLTNGTTWTNGDVTFDEAGGGIWCESSGANISNCWISGNSAAVSGGGVLRGTLTACVITGNTAVSSAGGVWQSTLKNCTLSGNLAYSGGGASGSTLMDCTITNNSAHTDAYGSEASGGGVDSSTLDHCVLANNAADESGGGASGSTLNNCLITGNSSVYAGAVVGCTLNNCTVAGNFGAGAYNGEGGGGPDNSTLNNCIVYYNTPPRQPDYNDNTFTYCCLSPDPGGTGDITNEPAFVDLANNDFHLQSTSPCINAGNNAYVNSTTDFDGNSRIQGGTVDIGAYEYQAPVSKVSYQWLEQYGLPITANTDSSHPNGTSFNVY